MMCRIPPPEKKDIRKQEKIMSYDINKIREDFPILGREVYGKPLVYLDNGATTQKPRSVVEAMTHEYYNVNANVHRGVHFLSQQATELHEQARETVRRFLNARSTAEIVFTRGTTESINLVATTFGDAILKEGDEVIVSEMEHHSNIVSWQLVQARKGIRLRVIPITDEGELRLDEYEKLFNERTRLVSITHVSNVLGTVNPVKEMIRTAHAHGVPVLVDGAQSTPHFAVDVQDLDCDFFAFSGHKIYGPTGIGVLYGKEEWLDRLPPYMGGGEMIQNVSFERTTFNELPYKFEAGTPDYVATTGLAHALDYVTALGMDNIYAHEQELTRYAMEQMATIEDMRFIGTPKHKDAVISFLVGDIHHLDLGTLLDRLGIAVRTGHHCAEPLMHRMGIEGTVRASFGLYNTFEEVDALVAGIRRVARMF
jgi:cysteine desulfurase/selenocysteine lyase